MHVFQTFETLVDNVLFVNVFQNVSSYNSMQVRIHKIKHKVNVPIIFCSYSILQPNYILVTRQFLQKYNLTECPLGVSSILKGIEVLLQSDDLLGPFINGFPYNTICTFSQFLNDFIFLENMCLDFLRHF